MNAPLVKVDLFDEPAPGENANILEESISLTASGALRVTVSLTTESVFNVIVSRSGTSFTIGLNASAALNAGDLYTFTFGASKNNTYNFQLETDSVIRVLQVEEVLNGVI